MAIDFSHAPKAQAVFEAARQKAAAAVDHPGPGGALARYHMTQGFPQHFVIEEIGRETPWGVLIAAMARAWAPAIVAVAVNVHGIKPDVMLDAFIASILEEARKALADLAAGNGRVEAAVLARTADGMRDSDLLSAVLAKGGKP